MYTCKIAIYMALFISPIIKDPMEDFGNTLYYYVMRGVPNPCGARGF